MHVPVRNDAALALLLDPFLALLCRCRFSRRSGIRCCSCGLWFFCHVSLHSFDSLNLRDRKNGGIPPHSKNSRPEKLALLADSLLLRCHGAAPRTFASARVGMRALAAHRKIPAVANPAIGLNFNQPADG